LFIIHIKGPDIIILRNLLIIVNADVLAVLIVNTDAIEMEKCAKSKFDVISIMGIIKCVEVNLCKSETMTEYDKDILVDMCLLFFFEKKS